MPVLGNVSDGNQSDKVWNREVLDEIGTSFLDPRRVVYFADSALVTAENLDKMASQKMRFISRLPGTYALVDSLRERAWKEDNWEALGRIDLSKKGARYQAQSFIETLENRSYRFVVVHSDSLEKRKAKTLGKAIEREAQEIHRARVKLEKERFDCECATKRAVEDLCKKHGRSHHRITGRILAEEVTKRPPGRPKKDVQPSVTVEYRTELDVVAPSEKELRKKEQLAGTFVLIATLAEDEWGNAEILEEYKGQASVEIRFRNLKADPCIVDNLYVKSSRRAEALASSPQSSIYSRLFSRSTSAGLKRLAVGMPDADPSIFTVTWPVPLPNLLFPRAYMFTFGPGPVDDVHYLPIWPLWPHR
jgi:transposase